MLNVVLFLVLFNPQVPFVDGLFSEEVFPVSDLSLAHECLIEREKNQYQYFQARRENVSLLLRILCPRVHHS